VCKFVVNFTYTCTINAFICKVDGLAQLFPVRNFEWIAVFEEFLLLSFVIFVVLHLVFEVACLLFALVLPLLALLFERVVNFVYFVLNVTFVVHVGAALDFVFLPGLFVD